MCFIVVYTFAFPFARSASAGFSLNCSLLHPLHPLHPLSSSSECFAAFCLQRVNTSFLLSRRRVRFGGWQGDESSIRAKGFSTTRGDGNEALTRGYYYWLPRRLPTNTPRVDIRILTVSLSDFWHFIKFSIPKESRKDVVQSKEFTGLTLNTTSDENRCRVENAMVRPRGSQCALLKRIV